MPAEERRELLAGEVVHCPEELREAACFADAVGALAVTVKGPMEGAPRRDEVDALLKRG